MTTNQPQNVELPLGPAELLLLQRFGRGQSWLRALACTLARRGAAYRADNPDGTQTVIEVLGRSPLYKSGQFLFDILEWEDFMLDGPPPPVVPVTLDAVVLERLVRMLESVAEQLGGALDAFGPDGAFSGLR
jgi:hypothetical protein